MPKTRKNRGGARSKSYRKKRASKKQMSMRNSMYPSYSRLSQRKSYKQYRNRRIPVMMEESIVVGRRPSRAASILAKYRISAPRRAREARQAEQAERKARQAEMRPQVNNLTSMLQGLQFIKK